MLGDCEKLRAEMKAKVKNMEETIEALKLTKLQADRLHAEYGRVEKQEVEITKDQTTLKDDIAPLRQRLHEILDLERNLGVIEGQLNGKKHQLQSVTAIKDELKTGQTDTFACSDAELFKMTLEFESNLKNQERRLQAQTITFNRLECEIDDTKKVESKALQMLGQLIAGHQNHLVNIKSRNKTMQDLVSKYDIMKFIGSDEFDYNDSTLVLDELNDLRNSTQN